MLKRLLKRHFSNLWFYHQYQGVGILFMLVMSMVVGILDGFGLAMFVPLLQVVSGDDSFVSPEAIGNLKFLIDWTTYLGFEINLEVVLLLIAFFFTLKGCAKWFEQFLKVVNNQKLTLRARKQLLNNLNRFQYSRFVSNSSGRLQNALTGEIGRLSQSFFSYSQMFQNLILLITYLTLALVANPAFALMVVIGGLLTNILFKIFYKKTKTFSENLVIETNVLQSLIVQFVSGFKYLKATNSSYKYSSHIKDQINKVESTRRSIGEIESLSTGLREPIMVYILVSALCIQAFYIGGNIGSVTVSLLFLYRGLSSIVLIQSGYNRFLSFDGSIKNFVTLNDEVFSNAENYSGQQINRISKSIEFRNVCLAYDGKKILNKTSFIFKKEDSICIIGESGSGKTTIFNLIAGLIRPDSGQILIDGKELESINILYYQKRVGYITQEPIIFEDTIFNNVTFWDFKTEENIRRFYTAIEKASLTEYVHLLKLKENEPLGINASNVSGGQRQRISIARELYKDIDILLLDEATSALDVEIQNQIIETVLGLQSEIMVIFITHNKNRIQNFNKIYEIKNGQIIEQYR
ncbi:MAG: ABC transporter ATP-binding protein [Bacteroidota bacterium]